MTPVNTLLVIMVLVDAFLVDVMAGDYGSGVAILVLIVQDLCISGGDGSDQCIAGGHL